ncbi:hypothetical protein HHI36_014683 [Cryptolaemus montrouzieri]|uniref:Uncharacterized protein n=1 Tax=Cryptolaemus montrouzieri TaxID=559131 RepID=A0ABD2N4I3_9CUCU
MVWLDQDDLLENIQADYRKQSVLVDSDTLKGKTKNSNIVFNLLHPNIRSMAKNLDNLMLLLHDFDLYFNNIIVLSGTFRTSSVAQCNVPGNQLFYNSADYNKNDAEKLSISLATVCRITCVVNGMKIGITAVYKPPTIPKNDFVEDIHNYPETNALGGDNNFELLVGDMNMDLLNIDDISYNYLTAMSQLGFESYIN